MYLTITIYFPFLIHEVVLSNFQHTRVCVYQFIKTLSNVIFLQAQEESVPYMNSC